jgi:CBS domain-containing protein
MPRPTKRSGDWRIAIWVLLSSRNPGRLVGIFTERVYAWNVFLNRLLLSLIRALATSCVVYSDPDQQVDEGMALITDRHVRHLPMIDGGNLCGVVSIGNLERASSATGDRQRQEAAGALHR